MVTIDGFVYSRELTYLVDCGVMEASGSPKVSGLYEDVKKHVTLMNETPDQKAEAIRGDTVPAAIRLPGEPAWDFTAPAGTAKRIRQEIRFPMNLHWTKARIPLRRDTRSGGVPAEPRM